MTKTLPINYLKSIFLIIFTCALMFFAVNSVFSQSPAPEDEGSVAPPAVELVFPIKDLGSCANLEDCTNFCEDPVNQNSCSVFAKENGFYKDDVSTYADQEFWTDAKGELGCDSQESCSNFCSDPANQGSCDSFAKRNEIPGGYTATPDSEENLAVAKEVLGCDSAESCSTFCDDSANAAKCSNFANQVGLQGGTVTVGPGGCQTPGTCGAYCADPANFEQCKTDSGNNFAGPGGCNSEESCRSYCEQNPDSCRSFAPGSNGVYVPITCAEGETHGPGGVCTALANIPVAAVCLEGDKYWNGNSCNSQPPIGVDPDFASGHFEAKSEMGNCTTPGECYDFCKQNPNSCEGFDANTERPTDDYTPYIYYTPGTEVTHEPVASMGGCDSPAACHDYCSNNPADCAGFNDDSPRPPEIYIPGTYYTPPADTVYVTPSLTGFYTTPIYYTPPEGSTYTTPHYYTPPTYMTPYYYSPSGGYSTPAQYSTPPTYSTPQYFTPYGGGGYTTPTYYTPPTYSTPTYYTPPIGSTYTSPSYYTPPPPYSTPTYYTPGTYPTPPTYSTPVAYSTPSYSYPSPGGVGYVPGV